MVKIDTLFKKGLITRISELEMERYINFFENSYQDNLEHSKKNITEFPRWSIISGYYAMHDITKLLIVKKFRIKVEFNVHKITIQLLKELIKNKELNFLIKKGYAEFLTLANDLSKARKERTKVQYYTGTKFLREEYTKRAGEFYEKVVLIFIQKIKKLIEQEEK